MRLIPIHPENLNLAWNDAEKYIQKGLKFADSKYEMVDIQRMIFDGSLVLWISYNDKNKKAEGCCLTEVIDYPQVRALGIFLMSGEDIEDLLPLLDTLKKYAEAINCAIIECYGRPGWEKILKPSGFEKTHTVMRLRL